MHKNALFLLKSCKIAQRLPPDLQMAFSFEPRPHQTPIIENSGLRHWCRRYISRIVL